jgi:hypothetical protein
MDQDVGSLKALVNVSCSLMEVFADIKRLVILGWDVQEVRDFLLGMGYLYSLGCCQQSTYLEFSIKTRHTSKGIKVLGGLEVADVQPASTFDWINDAA